MHIQAEFGQNCILHEVNGTRARYEIPQTGKPGIEQGSSLAQIFGLLEQNKASKLAMELKR